MKLFAGRPLELWLFCTIVACGGSSHAAAADAAPAALVEGGRNLQATDCDWVQIGNDLFGEGADHYLGESAVFSGDGTTFALGSSWYQTSTGFTRVYTINEDGSVVSQLGNTIVGEAQYNFAGHSIAISEDGRTVAIGARFNDVVNGIDSNEGHVRVYTYTSATQLWSQVGQDIDGEAQEDYSGLSVTLSADGSVCAIGSINNDGNGNDSGHVRVFQLVFQVGVGNWLQMGSDIDGSSAGDRLGLGVSLSADGLTLAVVAVADTFNNSHIVRVFRYDSVQGEWLQLGGDIEVDGAAAVTQFRPLSLSEDGLTVAVGTPGTSNGGVVVFTLSADDEWVQLPFMIEGRAERDGFGGAVSMSEATASIRTVAVSALQELNGGTGYVRAYRFSSDGENWIQVGGDLEGDGIGDAFGNAVSLSNDGTRLVVGALYNDGSGAQSGQVRVFGIDSNCLPDPTRPPTASPTTVVDGERIDEMFESIMMVFVGVEQLGLQSQNDFEDIYEEWYQSYFEANSEAVGARNMETRITFRSQSMLDDTRSAITYDQSISYDEQPEASLSSEGLISLPFTDEQERQKLVVSLAEGIDEFSDVQSPIDQPVLLVSQEMDPSDTSDSNGVSVGLIAGIAVGGVIGIAVVAGILFGIRRKRSEGGGGDENELVEQVQANSVDDFRATIPDPISVVAVQVLPDSDYTGLPEFKDQVRSVGNRQANAQPSPAPQTAHVTPSSASKFGPDYKDQCRSRRPPSSRDP